MVYMMRLVEQSGDTMLLNIFPQRTSIVPGYVTLDTKTLILLCHEDKHKDQLGTKTTLCQNITARNAEIWATFFRTEQACFQESKYTFHFQMQTDGVACSILMKKTSQGGQEPELKRRRKKPPRERYVTDIDPSELMKETFVAIDPNKADLIYCSTETKTFRYTQNQKRKETKEKKHRRKRQLLREQNAMVKQVEDEFSTACQEGKFNRTSLDVEAYKRYLSHKNQVNHDLEKFYAQPEFRKMKWWAFVNRRRSEDRMLNRFKAKFGEDATVMFGDWAQKHQMKFLEPTKGIGMRRLFKRAGLKVLLVDEHRTSCTCSGCGGHNEKFREVQNPRSWMRAKNPTVLRNGLLKCTTCQELWNRDRNSSLNILKVARCAAEGLERPAHLQFSGATPPKKRTSARTARQETSLPQTVREELK
jgi:hypothetical protein